MIRTFSKYYFIFFILSLSSLSFIVGNNDDKHAFEGKWSAEIVASYVKDNLALTEESSDHAILILEKSGENLNGNITSELMSHQIQITLDTLTSGHVTLVHDDDQDVLFEFSLIDIGGHLVSQGLFKDGYYQLTIKDNQFTFNLFDKKFTKLTTIIGTREIEKPQLTFFQQFGMPIVAGIVIILSQAFKHWARGAVSQRAEVRERPQPQEVREGRDKKND